MKVPAEKLRTVLGLTNVFYTEHQHSLAITDKPLMEAGKMEPMNNNQ
jgi:hypothetical protein